MFQSLFSNHGRSPGEIFGLELFAVAFILVVGSVVLWVIVTYILDVTQTRHAIRRNFPVIGRFRYFFGHLGAFFRQYFFARAD